MLYIVIILLIISLLIVEAQEAKFDDIIYLKNNNIMWGKIIAIIPEEKIILQSLDGNVKEIKYIDVLKIIRGGKEEISVTAEDSIKNTKKTTNELVSPKLLNIQKTYSQQSINSTSDSVSNISSVTKYNIFPYFEIFGGLALPLGQFAANDTGGGYSGFAKKGYSVGFKYILNFRHNFQGGFIGNLNFFPFDENKFNSSNVSTKVDNWVFFWALGTVGYNVLHTDSTAFYFGGLFGILFGSFPEFTRKVGYVEEVVAPKGATSRGYGFNAGLIIYKFEINFSFLKTEIEYPIPGSVGYVLQPTSLIQFTVGYILK